jgi:quercetin dioxygenase-like cupin family protein
MHLSSFLVVLIRGDAAGMIDRGVILFCADQLQRMLNAIEPGSVVPIHRHRKSSETVVCLRGRLVEK